MRGRPASALAALAAWLGIALVGAAGVLFWPRASGARSGLLDACLIDVSSSALRDRPAYPAFARAAVARAAGLAKERGAQLLVATFGLGVQRLAGPSGDPDLAAKALAGAWPSSDGAVQSDLSPALAFVHGALAEEQARLGRLTVISDGAITDADAAAQWRFLNGPPGQDASSEVELVLAPQRAHANARVVSLDVPRLVEPRQSLLASAAVELDDAPLPTAPLQLTFELLDAAGAVHAAAVRSLPAQSSSGVERVQVQLAPVPAGRFEVRARVRLEADPVPEDDQARAQGVCGQAPLVAVLCTASAQADARLFAQALGDCLQQPVATWVDEGAAGSEPPLADAYVAFDLSRSALDREWLQGAVEAGAGLVVCLGPAALESAAAARLAPLWPALPEREPRQVCLLADSSGSMAGPAFQALRLAAQDLAAFVPSTDLVELILFTSKLGPRHTLSGLDRAATARTLLQLAAPGGPTDIVACLMEWASAREELAPSCELLLLSDGRDQQATAAQIERCQAELERSRARLCVFAFGPSPDLDFLARLVPKERPPIAAPDAESLARAVQSHLQTERWFFPVQVAWGEPSQLVPGSAAQLFALALEKHGAGSGPPLPGRALRAKPTLQAGELARFEDGSPALAYARYGTGNVLAVPHLWRVHDTPALEYLAALVRALGSSAREREQRDLVLEWDEQDLVLRHVPSTWPMCVELRWNQDFRVGLPPVQGRSLTLCIPPLAPGEDVLRVRRARAAEYLGDLWDLGHGPNLARMHAPASGSELARLFLPMPRAAGEWSAPRAAFSNALAQAEQGPARGESEVATSRPSALARPVLILGLVLFALGILAGRQAS